MAWSFQSWRAWYGGAAVLVVAGASIGVWISGGGRQWRPAVELEISAGAVERSLALSSGAVPAFDPDGAPNWVLYFQGYERFPTNNGAGYLATTNAIGRYPSRHVRDAVLARVQEFAEHGATLYGSQYSQGGGFLDGGLYGYPVTNVVLTGRDIFAFTNEVAYGRAPFWIDVFGVAPYGTDFERQIRTNDYWRLYESMRPMAGTTFFAPRDYAWDSADGVSNYCTWVGYGSGATHAAAYNAALLDYYASPDVEYSKDSTVAWSAWANADWGHMVSLDGTANECMIVGFATRMRPAFELPSYTSCAARVYFAVTEPWGAVESEPTADDGYEWYQTGAFADANTWYEVFTTNLVGGATHSVTGTAYQATLSQPSIWATLQFSLDEAASTNVVYGAAAWGWRATLEYDFEFCD